MNEEINQLLISLLSSSNSDSWIDEYDEEQRWAYEDGTIVVSQAIEYGDVGSWLETYDELGEKIVDSIDAVSFSDPDIELILDTQGNLLEFQYSLFFENTEVRYRYVQYGDGNEAAREILLSESLDIIKFKKWLSNAIENEWFVTSAN